MSSEKVDSDAGCLPTMCKNSGRKKKAGNKQKSN